MLTRSKIPPFSLFCEVAEQLTSRPFVFAKTMPHNPHYYTLRKLWNDDALFDKVVLTMREYGYAEIFGRRTYTMFDVNQYKYWTMGDPLSSTWVLNRKPVVIDRDFDDLAEGYDQAFTDHASIEENCEITERLKLKGSVLDVGCGTGLLLDYLEIADYTGIDPSAKMLERLLAKHPDATTVQTTFEAFYTPRRFDNVVALFGAANYINPQALGRLRDYLTPGGRYFVMFYKNDYTPVCYQRLNRKLDHWPYDGDNFGGRLTSYHNFWIVEGERCTGK